MLMGTGKDGVEVYALGQSKHTHDTKGQTKVPHTVHQHRLDGSLVGLNPSVPEVNEQVRG